MTVSMSGIVAPATSGAINSQPLAATAAPNARSMNSGVEPAPCRSRQVVTPAIVASGASASYAGQVTAENSWRARTSTGQACQHVRICDAEVGEVVEVSGSVHSVTLHPSGGLESFEADVSDETGLVHLVWLGRRRLTGIVPSRQISARGRIAMRAGRKVIFNPEYELTIPSIG